MEYSTTTKLSDENLQEIFRLYKSGVGVCELGRKFHVSHRSIGWRLKKNSIDDHGNVIKINRVVPEEKLLGTGKFDWDAFQKAPEKEKAYWAGFIAADGCIKKNTLIIDLADKDKKHLEWWNEFSVSIHHNDRRNSTSLRATSPDLISWLNEWKIYERKTGNEIFPEHQPDNLLVHWVRGIIDGDGYFTINQDCVMGGISSASHSFLESIQNFLTQNNIESKLRTFNLPNKLPHYKLLFYQRMSFRLADLVDGGIKLDRKWNKIKHARSNQQAMSDSTIERIHNLRKQGLSLRAIAKKVKRSASGVRWRLKHGL